MAAKLDYHWHLRKDMADRERSLMPCSTSSKPKKAAVGGTAADAEGLGGLRPKRARIRGADRP
ncbi:hypothetical protein [Streptomyces sp. ME19-01-6]|uniref:hypothetical protein n=1 Tax=Streptomyces sp. ME19-01-6 TaxID=3028686 RepID=UPI0029A07ED6|nr:hypothetical protein [Streptomyces sp. ME19-01-6]MDX3229152.1 hypothetical protein [Streptomyces sp. ME19-01-6]